MCIQRLQCEVEGAKEATAFTKEYEEHVDSVLKKVQAIKAEREQARYDEITSTARKKWMKHKKS